ncbi:arginine--tRNA ligase, chloroplastic/mitochondrial [Tanacetum coccineum]
MPRHSTRRAKKPAQVTRAEKLTTRDKVIKQYGRAMIRYEIAFEINEAIQKSYSPYLRDEICFFQRLWGDLNKKHGDYICKSIFRVCEILRLKDPTLFDKTKPTDIAKVIIDNFPKSDMLEELKIVDVGFITFKLNGDWMAKRIRNNLKEGIAAWAPLLSTKRAIVGFPVQGIADAKKLTDGVRSGYIRDTVVHILEYCGVEVSGTMRNQQALHKVKNYFPEEHGIIRKKGISKALFSIKEKASHKGQPNNVYEDLAALWCGFYEQKADWIVYVTPVRQRDYILKCFDAANGYYRVKDFAAHRDFKNEDRPTMSYLGYQTSGDEQRKLAVLCQLFESSYKVALLKEGKEYGYSPEAIFECTIRYEYLKKITYSDCTLENFDEMLLGKGNTFLYILATKTQIRSVLLEHSSPNLESNKALVGREREMGLDLLQFTEIIEESIAGFSPNWLCEYLYNLSEKLTTYMCENVEQLSETGVLLLKAAEVVMEQSFHLLGFTPGSSTGALSYVKGQSGEHMAIRDVYISCPVSRPCLKSRFEIFTMYIEVNHSDFKNGYLFGNISASDKFGLRSDTWCDVDRNGCGHVAYFDHDWHDSVGIKDTSFLSLGDPASRHSVAFSSSIEIGVHLWVTSKNDKENDKEACYQLCDAKEGIELQGFWRGDQTLERSAFYAEGDNGSLCMYYFLLKEAVDTCLRLEYKTFDGDPQVRGYILASYGGDALDDCVNDFEKNSYKAEVFRTQPTRLLGGDLTLKKSALAVPTNGVLVFEAFFEDVDSGELIVKDTHK